MKMDELLKNRWSERDRELNEKILKSQNEMNSRGILHSSIAVKALHDVFAEEFSCGRQTIVSTVADSLRLGTVKLNRASFENWAIDQLQQRQEYLDRYFDERARVSMSALQNQSMIAPFTNIAQYYEHASQESAIELKSAVDNYEISLGATLYDRVLNNFKNHPVVVIGAVVITVLLAIFGLIEAIRKVVI